MWTQMGSFVFPNQWSDNSAVCGIFWRVMSSDVTMETVEIQEPEQKETWSECVLSGLNEMRQNNTLCDVILNSADNKLFCVHSAVLGAGSRFFRQVLSQSKSSGGGIVVRLEKSSALVSKMVDFLYTGRTAASVEELEELRQMADGYGLERLSSLCTERLYGITVTVVPTANTEPEDADAGLHTLVESIAYTEGVTAAEPTDNVVLDNEGVDMSQQGQVPLPIGDSLLDNRCRRHPSAVRPATRPGVCGKKTWRDYRYKCTVCGKEFTSLSRLRGHEATHSGEKRHECTICGARFIQIEYLREHVSMHSNVRPFRCDICNASFRLGRHLKKHQKVHSSERPYACSLCGKTFKRADRLRQHDRVHSGERPYPCPHCDKSFKVMEALVRHKRALHYEDCPFRCGFCGTGFKRMKGLEDHLRSCDTAMQRRSLQCDVCGSFFKTKITLLRHKRKHLFPEEEAEKENAEKSSNNETAAIVKQEKTDESNNVTTASTLTSNAADLSTLEPVHLIQSGDQEIEGTELGESAIQMLMQTATEVNPEDTVDTQEMPDDSCIQVLHVEFVSDHGVADANGHVVEEVTAEQMAAELHATTQEGVEEVSPEVQFVHEAIAAADHSQYVMSEAMPTTSEQPSFMHEVMAEPDHEQPTLQGL